MVTKTRKLGRGVALVGSGMSKFGTFPDKNSRDLFVEAFAEMRASVDKGLDMKDVGALYFGNYSSDLFEGQGHSGPLMGDWIGLTPRPTIRTEGACASSGSAVRQAILAVASGAYDVVLAGGAEKMSDLATEQVQGALGAAGDSIYEFRPGFTFPGLYAAMATAYMHKYGATLEHFMKVGIKNHNNGALNPKAQFNTTIKDIMERRIARAKQRGRPVPTWKDEWEFLNDPAANPTVAWPLKLYDCSPITDGAACLLIVSEEIAKNFTDTPIYIIGSGLGSDYFALHERADITTIAGAREAARQAYEMARVTPQDIRIAEVHDCFTSAEMVAIEDLGFVRPGGAIKAVDDGITARNAVKPINTSGGLKAKGHPVGASGAGQLVEIWQQMRGEAGPRQVPIDVPLALTHNVGATGGTCAVHIFERR